MAYLHCHTKGCGWSQDDFWDFKFQKKYGYFKFFGIGWKYNPFSLWLTYLEYYWTPRWIYCDIMPNKGKKIHSWSILLKETWKILKRFKTQKWWTWKSWQKAKATAVCPRCGKRNFDID